MVPTPRRPGLFARGCAACLIALVLGGCGIKTAYNNLDRLIVWTSNDYVEFDRIQKAYLRSELDALLYWHRRTQLPLYANGLRTLEREVRGGLDIETLIAIESRVRVWGESLAMASIPLFGELLYSLSDAQIVELEAGLEASNLRWLKPYKGLDADARSAVWSDEFEDAIETFTGRLDRAQKAVIDRYRSRYRPDDDAWLDYRRRWQAALVTLIRERRSYEQFELAFRDMATNRERWYGDEYRRLFEHNESMYRDLTLELLAALDARQLDRFSDRVLSVATDFDELAADTRVKEPPPACLVTCEMAEAGSVAR